MDAYVETYRRLLNGSTADERLRMLAEDPEKYASLAESMGRVLVNGSLGYQEGKHVYLRRGFALLFRKLYMLYKDLPKHVDYRTPSAFVHDASCLHNGPCFAKTMDNFDILTEGTKSILKRVAVCFLHNCTDSLQETVGTLLSMRQSPFFAGRITNQSVFNRINKFLDTGMPECDISVARLAWSEISNEMSWASTDRGNCAFGNSRPSTYAFRSCTLGT